MPRFPLAIALLSMLAICISATSAPAEEKSAPVDCTIAHVEVDDNVIIVVIAGQQFEGVVLLKDAKTIKLRCEVKFGVFERVFNIEDIRSVKKYIRAADLIGRGDDVLNGNDIERIEELFALCVAVADYERALKAAEAGRDVIAETLDRQDEPAMCDFADWCRGHFLFKDARELYAAILDANPSLKRAVEGLSYVGATELMYKRMLFVRDAPERLKQAIETRVGLGKLTVKSYRDACRAIESFLDEGARSLRAFEGYTFDIFEDYCVLESDSPEILWAESTDAQRFQALIDYGVSYAALPPGERMAKRSAIVRRETACREDIVTVRCPNDCVNGRYDRRDICHICYGKAPGELLCPTCQVKGEWSGKCEYCGGTGGKLCRKCGGTGFRRMKKPPAGEEVDCWRCNGTGRINVTPEMPEGRECLACGGTGKRRRDIVEKDGKYPCEYCSGGRIVCSKCKGWGVTTWYCYRCGRMGKLTDKHCRVCGGTGVLETYMPCDHGGLKIGRRHRTPGFHTGGVVDKPPGDDDVIQPELDPGPGPNKAVVVLGVVFALSEIAGGGSRLTLDDRSVWEVRLTDASSAAEWTASDKIAVVETARQDYPYALVNITAGDAAEARPIYLPETEDPRSFPARGLFYFGKRDGRRVLQNIKCGVYFVLEDGSLWQIAPADSLNAMLWKSGEKVDIADSEKEDYPYVLTNLTRKAKAKARLVAD